MPMLLVEADGVARSLDETLGGTIQGPPAHSGAPQGADSRSAADTTFPGRRAQDRQAGACA